MAISRTGGAPIAQPSTDAQRTQTTEEGATAAFARHHKKHRSGKNQTDIKGARSWDLVNKGGVFSSKPNSPDKYTRNIFHKPEKFAEAFKKDQTYVDPRGLLAQGTDDQFMTKLEVHLQVYGKSMEQLIDSANSYDALSKKSKSANQNKPSLNALLNVVKQNLDNLKTIKNSIAKAVQNEGKDLNDHLSNVAARANFIAKVAYKTADGNYQRVTTELNSQQNEDVSGKKNKPPKFKDLRKQLEKVALSAGKSPADFTDAKDEEKAKSNLEALGTASNNRMTRTRSVKLDKMVIKTAIDSGLHNPDSGEEEEGDYSVINSGNTMGGLSTNLLQNMPANLRAHIAQQFQKEIQTELEEGATDDESFEFSSDEDNYYENAVVVGGSAEGGKLEEDYYENAVVVGGSAEGETENTYDVVGKARESSPSSGNEPVYGLASATPTVPKKEKPETPLLNKLIAALQEQKQIKEAAQATTATAKPATSPKAAPAPASATEADTNDEYAVVTKKKPATSPKAGADSGVVNELEKILAQRRGKTDEPAPVPKAAPPATPPKPGKV